MRYPELNTYTNHLLMLSQSDGKRDTTRLNRWLKMFTVVNPRIAGLINSRKAAVASWDYAITHIDPNKQAQADEARSRTRQAIQTLAEATVEQQIFGLFAVELAWIGEEGNITPLASQIDITKLSPESPESARTTRNGKETTLEGSNFIAGSSANIGGQLGSIGELEILRRDMIFEWANFNRKQKGIIHAIEHGASDEEIQAGKEALQSVVRNNYLMTSDLMDFAFHQITTSGAGESFRAMIEHINTQIAIALVGQANTVELPAKTGSRAALEVQQAITDDLMWRDLSIATNHINRLLQYDYEKNYGAAAGRCPWRFEFITNEGQDAETNANVISIALAAGIPLLESEVYEKLAFTAPNAGDKIFQPQGI